MPNFDTIQGIGGIKELLYADFSLFLIFSTVVLLVALFGAAIMTRKK
jgi:NADH:ubiquinone oxidoreductase subunit 6 (subunit J)